MPATPPVLILHGSVRMLEHRDLLQKQLPQRLLILFLALKRELHLCPVRQVRSSVDFGQARRAQAVRNTDTSFAAHNQTTRHQHFHRRRVHTYKSRMGAGACTVL